MTNGNSRVINQIIPGTLVNNNNKMMVHNKRFMSSHGHWENEREQFCKIATMNVMEKLHGNKILWEGNYSFKEAYYNTVDLEILKAYINNNSKKNELKKYTCVSEQGKVCLFVCLLL